MGARNTHAARHTRRECTLQAHQRRPLQAGPNAITGAAQLVEFPSSAVATWGGAFVFINVLLTRLGVPIPAVPVLLFAGSAIAAGTLSFWPILLAAVLGALIGDAA